MHYWLGAIDCAMGAVEAHKLKVCARSMLAACPDTRGGRIAPACARADRPTVTRRQMVTRCDFSRPALERAAGSAFTFVPRAAHPFHRRTLIERAGIVVNVGSQVHLFAIVCWRK